MQAMRRILEELDYAEKIMKRIGCPVINVSEKAIEETADYILECVKKREEFLKMTKFVYMFNEGNSNMRELLGGKGANLAEMTTLVYLFRSDLQLQQRLVMLIMRQGKQISR